MARTVPLKLSYAARSSLVRGPSYTIQEDPPWLLNVNAHSPSTTEHEPRPSSTYSSHDFAVHETDLDSSPASAVGGLTTNSNMDDNYIAGNSTARTAPSPPLIEVKQPRQVQQEALTAQQQTRTARMPIFKQVRSMLSNNRTTGNSSSPTSAIKWDEYSGEISEHGKEARVKPSTYKSPYEGILKPRRLSPGAARRAEQRDRSPVSVLVDEDFQLLDKEPGAMSPPNSRPVSPISDMESHYVAPLQLDSSIAARPRTEGNATGQVKRKPVASQIEDFPPVGESRVMPNSSHGLPTHTDEPSSRFSWTTAAVSDAPRQSTDTRFSRQQRSVTDNETHYNSHFSWSTVASAVPMGLREQTPPPSPPPVPLQYLEAPNYGPPPTQSILSRQRPTKKVDKPEWAPPPAPTTTLTPRSLTPRVYRIEDHDVSTTPGADGKKRLPLPPLFTEKSLSHLESLLTQEKNIVMQRRNIERSIIDLERIEKASPLEVSFADVRNAKKKLEERRGVLDEIRKEEMDIGIRIARARRKEDFGDGEGTLWVRRVTG